MPKLFIQIIWFILNACFPSSSLEFWYVQGRVCLRDQPPVKTLGTESHMSFPSGHFTFVITNPCWRNLMHPVWLYWEETLGSLHLVSSSHSPNQPSSFPPDFPCLSFFPLWAFAVINHSSEYDYMLTFVSSLVKSLKFWVIVATPDISYYSILSCFH